MLVDAKMLASADARICGNDTDDTIVRCYSGAQGGVETAYSFFASYTQWMEEA